MPDLSEFTILQLKQLGLDDAAIADVQTTGQWKGNTHAGETAIAVDENGNLALTTASTHIANIGGLAGPEVGEKIQAMLASLGPSGGAMMRKKLSDVESTHGIDLDGDGKIGSIGGNSEPSSTAAADGSSYATPMADQPSPITRSAGTGTDSPISVGGKSGGTSQILVWAIIALTVIAVAIYLGMR